MSDFKYNVAMRDGEPESIMIFKSGQPSLIGTPDNPQFAAVLDLVKQEGVTFEDVANKLSVAHAVAIEFARLSDRVTIAGGRVFFDNDEVHSSLAKAIADFHATGAGDYMALVNFMEKVMQNPEPHSREQLYEWMLRFNFGIAPDGDIIAYKGLNRSHKETGEEWISSNAGHAIVNGKAFNGHIPNKVGAIVEMPRSEVNHNPAEGCSTGLHVGNWAYASSFAHVTIRVKVNPRDICSVPVDCGWQKVRTCRYQVLGQVDAEDKGVLFVPDVYKTLCMSALDGGIDPNPKPKRRITTKPATRKLAKSVTKAVKEKTLKPIYFDDMNKAQFALVPFNELRWVAKEWGLKVSARPSKDELVQKLTRAATARRKKAAGLPARGAKAFKKTSTKR